MLLVWLGYNIIIAHYELYIKIRFTLSADVFHWGGSSITTEEGSFETNGPTTPFYCYTQEIQLAWDNTKLWQYHHFIWMMIVQDYGIPDMFVMAIVQYCGISSVLAMGILILHITMHWKEFFVEDFKYLFILH